MGEKRIPDTNLNVLNKRMEMVPENGAREWRFLCSLSGGRRPFLNVLNFIEFYFIEYLLFYF